MNYIICFLTAFVMKKKIDKEEEEEEVPEKNNNNDTHNKYGSTADNSIHLWHQTSLLSQ